MEYYSAIKKKNLAIYHNMDGSEGIVLSEMRQRERQMLHDLTYK